MSILQIKQWKKLSRKLNLDNDMGKVFSIILGNYCIPNGYLYIGTHTHTHTHASTQTEANTTTDMEHVSNTYPFISSAASHQSQQGSVVGSGTLCLAAFCK